MDLQTPVSFFEPPPPPPPPEPGPPLPEWHGLPEPVVPASFPLEASSSNGRRKGSLSRGRTRTAAIREAATRAQELWPEERPSGAWVRYA